MKNVVLGLLGGVIGCIIGCYAIKGQPSKSAEAFDGCEMRTIYTAGKLISVNDCNRR